MPCCVAKLHYRGCLHTTWFKLGCSHGCRAGCKRERRLLVAHVEYLWTCERCRLGCRQDEEDLRREEYRDWIELIDARRDLSAACKRAMVVCARDRAVREARQNNKRVAVMQREQARVGRWAFDYSWALCHATFSKSALTRFRWAKRSQALFLCKLWDVVVRSNIVDSEETLRVTQRLPACVGIEQPRVVTKPCMETKSEQDPKPKKVLPPVPLFHEAKEDGKEKEEEKEAERMEL